MNRFRVIDRNKEREKRVEGIRATERKKNTSPLWFTLYKSTTTYFPFMWKHTLTESKEKGEWAREKEKNRGKKGEHFWSSGLEDEPDGK